MGRLEFCDADAPKAFNQLARESMILCEIEGWDKREYLNRLKEVINSLDRK